MRYHECNMFEDNKPQSTDTPIPEDMFETVSESVPNVAPPTKESSPAAAAPSYSMPSVPPAFPSESGGGFPWKTIAIVVFVLALIAAAVGVSYYALSSKVQVNDPLITAPEPAVENPVTTPPVETPPVVTPPPVEETPVEVPPTTEPEPTPEEVVEEPVPVVDIDRDKDGLTDAEELALGTSPTNPDSDNDGLLDREEVQTYKTNPLDPDTDGDTYLDGEEVKNGYNPNGPGKLTTIPETVVTPS